MRAYSKDLRLKVLDAVDSGMPPKEVARIFGISLPSIKRWLRRRRETGDVASPLPYPVLRPGRAPCWRSGCPASSKALPT